MRIAIVALEGSMLSAVAGLSDLFWMTGQALRSPPEGPSQGITVPPDFALETQVVSPDGKPVLDPTGKLIHVDAAFQAADTYDAVIIAGMALGDDGLPPLTESVRQTSKWLEQCHNSGAWIAGACAGTFVLGEAGLLNGRRCTTTWWLHHAFKRRFPKANVAWGAAVEEEDRIVTTGGPLSWIDIALHMIRRLAGKEIAKLAAAIAVADTQPLPQAVYAPRGFVNTSDPITLRAEQIVRHTKPDITAEELAAALNLSERTLHRRLKDLLSESPKSFITRVRIETACMLLDIPGASVKQVASQCGYADEASFRRAFARQMGMSPINYKRWQEKRRTESEESPQNIHADQADSLKTPA